MNTPTNQPTAQATPDLGFSGHTPLPWSLPHFANPHVKCDCRYILSDGYCGSIATFDVDNGKCVTDGGNDAPPLSEAIANARLVHVAVHNYASLSSRMAGMQRALEACYGVLVTVTNGMEPRHSDVVTAISEARTALAEAARASKEGK